MNVKTLPQTKKFAAIEPRDASLNDVPYNRRIQPEDKQKQRIHDELLETLLSLNVSQFEALIACLLRSLAYEDVQIMRRTTPQRRSHKGRNAHGGFDLSACSSTFSPFLTLVQAKQYKRPVSRRFVDELRGAMIRQGAQSGLLITTSRFPDGARTSARENQLLPILLIDGGHLLDLLFRFQIGVECNQGKRRMLWRLDRSFFQRLVPIHESR